MGLVQSLSQNTYLLALANVMAVAAAIAAIYKFGKTAISFSKSVYRTSIRVAIFRSRKKIYIISLWCAYDLHFYLSYIVRMSLVIAILIFTQLGIRQTEVKSRQIFTDAPPRIAFADYEQYVAYIRGLNTILMIIAIILIIATMFTAARLIFVAHNVTRIRLKWRRRDRLQGVSEITHAAP